MYQNRTTNESTKGLDHTALRGVVQSRSSRDATQFTASICFFAVRKKDLTHFLISRLVHPYRLNESVSSFRSSWWMYLFSLYFA